MTATEAQSTTHSASREYRWRMPQNWWTRNAHYFWYIVREFTALPLALWLLWFLVEIQRASAGPATYQPHSSLGFVIFSVICLGFALYHSITFLSLAGVIIHFKLFDKPVSSRLIVLSQFAMWALASIVIGAVLIGFAR
jgi:fumarate reductase subunit C